MITENLQTLKIIKLTQEQYNREASEGRLDANALYLTPDEEVDLSGYVTTSQLNEKADAEHTHNDIYYTEGEVDALLGDKSDTNHNHDDAYDAKGAAETAEQAAKGYADNLVNNYAKTEHNHISTDMIDFDIGVNVLIEAKNYTQAIETAKNDAFEYADTVTNTLKNDLLNGAGEAYDTLKELSDLINENVDAIEALETVASGKANADHIHNDIYYTKTEIDNQVSTINTSIINSLNNAQSYSDTNLGIAKTYTDNTVAQKAQVQIITWEADD